MPNTYVTFGQDHTHRVNGITFDCDCVAVIQAPSEEEGRARAFELFSGEFGTSYFEDQFDPDSLRFFPRGLINLENV